MSETIELLEDLAPELIEAMLTIASEKVDTDYDTVYRPLWNAGLVGWKESEDSDDIFAGFDILTERGAELVADYQRRQGNRGAASLKGFETIDGLNAQENSGLDRDTYNRVTGRTSQTNLEITKELAETATKLQAEIARLQAENATLTARNQEQGRDLAAALKRIEQLKDIVVSK